MALADSSRRKILQMLSRKQMAAGEIADRFEMSTSAVSQHLKVLKAAYLVIVQVDAQRRLYSVNKGGLKKAKDFLRLF